MLLFLPVLFKINLTMCFRDLCISLPSKHVIYLNEITFIKYTAQRLAHNMCLSRVKLQESGGGGSFKSPLLRAAVRLSLFGDWKKTKCWQQRWKGLICDYLQITQAELPVCLGLKQCNGKVVPPEERRAYLTKSFWLHARSQDKGMKESSRLAKMAPNYMVSLL